MNALAALQRLGTGQLIEELHAALIATVDEVVETGKPGTVTLTLKISNKGAGDVLVMIDEAIRRGSPTRPSRGAIFYAVDGELHREDPRQERMDFRLVDDIRGTVMNDSDDEEEAADER